MQIRDMASEAQCVAGRAKGRIGQECLRPGAHRCMYRPSAHIPPHIMLAIALPSVDLLIILAFAASLPIVFFVWIKWWLSHENEADPEQVVHEQEEADAAHLAHAHPAQPHAAAHSHAHPHPH